MRSIAAPAQPACLLAAPAALGFYTKVLNATSVQASWDLPPQPGLIQGFKLFHRKLPAAHFEGPLLLASSASPFLYTDLGETQTLGTGSLAVFHSNHAPSLPLWKLRFPLHISPADLFSPPLIASISFPPEPAALYEIKLQAFNGNGDGNSTARFVSLRDALTADAGMWGLGKPWGALL